MGFKVQDYRQEDGSLREWEWPGGYPLYYLVSHDVLCPACASQEQDDIAAAEANWEDPALHCEACGERIPSAYAEEQAEDQAQPSDSESEVTQ